jgi:hypothetical protein
VLGYPALIMRMLAALLYLPSCTYLLLIGNAAFALPPSSLRQISGGAPMTIPGGAGIPGTHIPLCSALRLLSEGGSSNLRPFALPQS